MNDILLSDFPDYIQQNFVGYDQIVKAKIYDCLVKAGYHKYIKREGYPGHYRYWYAEDINSGTVFDGKKDMTNNNKSQDGNRNEGRIRRCFENSKGREFVHNKSKRLSQDEESGRTKGGSRNVAATQILGGHEQSNRKEQEENLVRYAVNNNCWFEFEDIEKEFGNPFDFSGEESTVYKYDNKHVLKITKYYACKNPLAFLDDRIALHNHLFPETFYELIGFCRQKNTFCFVLKQPFIEGVEPGANEVHKEMTVNRNFQYNHVNVSYFSDDYIIWDLHPGNWLKKDEKLYCIDPMICLNPKNRTYFNI